MPRKSKQAEVSDAAPVAPPTPPRRKAKAGTAPVVNPGVASPAVTPAPKAPKVEADSTLRLRDLLSAVGTKCEGVKKADLRAVVEATLAEVGASLHKGQALNLPGLGKARVAKTKDKGEKSMLTVKIQQGEAKKPASPPLAEDDD